MGELQSALDALAADDLLALPPGAVLDRIASLVQARNRMDAELTRAVRHTDLTGAVEHDGLKSPRSWLIGHTRLSAAEASRIVRAGRALEHLPAVAAGFADGALTAGQVGVIAAIAEPDRLAAAAERGIDMTAIDDTLAATAAAAPHATVQQAVGHYLARLDADGAEPDPTEGRRLSIARHAGGSVTGRFDLDAVGGEK